jgi:hypothetical protein
VARATSSSPPAAVAPSTNAPPSQDAAPGLDDGSGLPQDNGSGALAPDPDPPTTHAS